MTQSFLMRGGKMSFEKNISNILKNKSTFFCFMLSTLIFQLAITYKIMMLDVESINVEKYFWLFIASEFAIILMMVFLPMPLVVKFALFSVFSAINGLLLQKIRQRIPARVIKFALLSAIGTFLAMMVLGIILAVFGINIGWMGIILFGALIGLIVSNFVILLTGETNAVRKTLSTIGVILFSMYVLFDTNIILQREYFGDFVMAALDFYLDFINLFLSFLRGAE